MNEKLTIAVSKGRIFKDALPLLADAGIHLTDHDPDASRKLILDTNVPEIKLVIIRAADVPTFVEYGAADVGIAGKDVLMEHNGEGVYEPLDLQIARCRLMVAGFPSLRDEHAARLRVATKYVHSTRRHYAQRGQQVDIIKLYGSMELAPIVGLADVIVDLVDTGNTLRANGLAPLETIAQISSRLIVNKASMKMKHPLLKGLIDRVGAAVAQRQQSASAAAR